MFETQRKRSKKLFEWKWSQIIDLVGFDDNDEEGILEDTVDPSTNLKTQFEIPWVSIQKHKRFHAV